MRGIDDVTGKGVNPPPPLSYPTPPLDAVYGQSRLTPREPSGMRSQRATSPTLHG